MPSLNYFEALLPLVLEKWADIRLSIFNNRSPQSMKAWKDIEALVGECPLNYSLNTYFKSKFTDAVKRKLHVELVSTFEQLERLRAEAEVEREKAELQFALALAEKFTGEEKAIRSTILQVAAQLKDNIFVANQPHIEETVSKAKVSSAKDQSRYSRAQLIYLHLIGIDVPFENCKNKDVVDELSVAWETALKKQFKKEYNGRPRRRTEKNKAVAEENDAEDEEDGNSIREDSGGPMSVRRHSERIEAMAQVKCAEDDDKEEEQDNSSEEGVPPLPKEREKELIEEIRALIKRARYLFEKGAKDVEVASMLLKEALEKLTTMPETADRGRLVHSAAELFKKYRKYDK